MRDRYSVEEEVEWRGKYRVDVVVVWRERGGEREKDVGGAEAETEAEWAFTNDNLSLFFLGWLWSHQGQRPTSVSCSARDYAIQGSYERIEHPSFLHLDTSQSKNIGTGTNRTYIRHTHARILRTRARTHELAYETKRMKRAHVLCLVTSRLPIYIS